jgi:DNA repair protein RecO (recombination protein O)
MMSVHCVAWAMMMSDKHRVQLQPAYIIHQRPYRDSSALLEIFSESYGRCALVAKGVKRPKSKLRGLLQPFQPLLISWIGKSELGTLTDAELFQQPIQIKPKYLASAFYLNELILYLLHRDDPHDELFHGYHSTMTKLQQLSGSETDGLLWQSHLRLFELMLMQSIGYGLVLDHDVRTQSPIDINSWYDYWMDYGPVKIEAETTDIRGVKVSGATLQMLSDRAVLFEHSRQANPVTLSLFKEAKRLMRTVVDHHLGSKVLHSRSLVVNAQSTSQSTDSALI